MQLDLLMDEGVFWGEGETTNAKHRQQFSERLKKELTLIGLPFSSQTQIPNEFNGRCPATAVPAQTVRKWLLMDAIPKQARLVGLANWHGVSRKWLRFGLIIRVYRVQLWLPYLHHIYVKSTPI